jgi:hypothetical protein
MNPNPHRLRLQFEKGVFAVCRLDRQSPIPTWAIRGDFYSITRTPDELSVVCEESSVPRGVRSEGGWRTLRVAGTIDFSVVGVLASLAVPLSEAGVALFAVSTFDTDYLLVKDRDLDRAIDVLGKFGHELPRGRADHSNPDP